MISNVIEPKESLHNVTIEFLNSSSDYLLKLIKVYRLSLLKFLNTLTNILYLPVFRTNGHNYHPYFVNIKSIYRHTRYIIQSIAVFTRNFVS